MRIMEDYLDNPRAERVKRVAGLKSKAGRGKSGQFLAEGPQAVRSALQTGAAAELYATEFALQRHPEIAELTRTAEGRLFLAEPSVIEAMADTGTPQGMLAVCHQLTQPLEEFLRSQPAEETDPGSAQQGEKRAAAGTVAVLCRIQDPGNAGTLIRASDSAGARAVVLTSGTVDPHSPKVVRSTAGSLFHMPILQGGTGPEVIEALKSAGYSVLAADGYGEEDLDALLDDVARQQASSPGEGGAPGQGPLLTRPTAWLFGNEAQGLDEAEERAADARVRVPLYGRAESLNVATAATVCLYASARAQRPGAQL